MKATLLDAKTQIDTSSLGVQSCSPAFLQLLNEATQRLLMGPESWWDVQHRMALCVENGCITWPRGIASIEAMSHCGPMTIRNGWFEFLESGYGIRGCNPCENQLFDRGTGVTFRDVRFGYSHKITTSVIEEEGLEFGILGYNCLGNWVRSQDINGAWRDGVWAPIPTNPLTPYTGQTQWALGGITELIKPVTNGLLNLFDWHLTSFDSQQIGVYEHDETRPSYRKSMVGGVKSDGPSHVTIMYRQEWKPVRNDNDFLLIANIPALSEMMQAIKLYRQNAFALASGHEGKAMQLLDREVSHYIGNGVVEPIRIDYRTFGVGSLPTLY